MLVLVVALGLAGDNRGLVNLRHVAGVIECRLVAHVTKVLVVPVPDSAAARVQLMLRYATLLCQSPVCHTQICYSAPLIVGQMAEQCVGGDMEAVQYVGGDAEKEDGPAKGK